VALGSRPDARLRPTVLLVRTPDGDYYDKRLVLNLAADPERGGPAARTVRRVLDPVTEGMRIVGGKPELWRLITYAALEGGDRLIDDGDSPFLADALERLEQGQREGRYNATVDAPLLMASGIALALGWAVFQRMLVRVAHLEQTPVDERIERIKAVWDDFIGPPPGPVGAREATEHA